MTTLTKKPNTSDGYLAVATKVYVTVNNDLTPIWHKVEGLIYDLDYLLGLTVRLKNTGEVLASGYLPELLLQATGNEQHLSAGGVLHRAARAFVSHFAELTPEARPVWRRHVATYQADFDKPVILYLDYLLNLNVCDKKTGEVLDSGYLPDLLSRQDGAMAVADIYNLPPDTRPAQMERVAITWNNTPTRRARKWMQRVTPAV